jgi:predicted nucleotidyltransferase
VTSAQEAGIAERLAESISRHPAVSSVELVGSRARGEATDLSDWDFEVETREFRAVAEALPSLVAPLEPLAQQWDRLSPHACYMLLLRGIGKVDLIFDEPWESSPPWTVSAATLRGIDDHFWDWTIWLAAKDRAGKQGLVEAELGKMHEHLLGPLGVERVPSNIADAVAVYAAARAEAEKRLATSAPRAMEDEVRKLLAAGAYEI